MDYFNELTFSLNDDRDDFAEIYERTRENPNEILSSPCHISDDSLDKFTNRFLDELFIGLEI